MCSGFDLTRPPDRGITNSAGAKPIGLFAQTLSFVQKPDFQGFLLIETTSSVHGVCCGLSGRKRYCVVAADEQTIAATR
jgi:hypothetical protein